MGFGVVSINVCLAPTGVPAVPQNTTQSKSTKESSFDFFEQRLRILCRDQQLISNHDVVFESTRARVFGSGRRTTFFRAKTVRCDFSESLPIQTEFWIKVGRRPIQFGWRLISSFVFHIDSPNNCSVQESRTNGAVILM